MSLFQGALFGISAHFMKIVPFENVNIEVAIFSGICIGSLAAPFLAFISVLFGKNGPILPIVIVFIIGILFNFVLEMIVYLVFGA